MLLFEMPIPDSVMKNIWRTGDVDFSDFASHWSDHVSPRVTYKITSERFINIHHKPVKRSTVRYDELIYFDKKEQQPVLVIILRLSEDVPTYPKGVTETEKEESFSTDTATELGQ